MTTDLAAAFKAQKHVTKRTFEKLRPRNVVLVKWKDAPNELAIVLDKVSRGEYEVRLLLLNTKSYRWVHYDQIVSIVGHLEVDMAALDIKLVK